MSLEFNFYQILVNFRIYIHIYLENIKFDCGHKILNIYIPT